MYFTKRRLTTRLGVAITLTALMTAAASVNAEEASTETENAGYHLVWEDNFDGPTLNTDDWNYETHDPGWVNEEWQEYVVSDENVFIKDGILTIKAIKSTDADGNTTYTSGRINTQNKHDFKYGRFEALAQVPNGKGFLPAFWMMPTDENLYGQWPKCGEIDIMEVLGDQTDTAHGTLHFGEPHAQDQGSYLLSDGDFSDSYHLFACEWEPGEIRFYVDGNLYHTANNWFSKREGFGELTYPAPFDQPFYMILNLAVGGSWVGYPDDDAVFEENAELRVDYVKVYQKDSYDEENVSKPEVSVDLREPDENGNYCMGDDAWEFLSAMEGEGSASAKDGELTIETVNEGTVDYSIQLVQAALPMEQGKSYRLSFDAWADEDRTMITDVSAPDKNYSRYLNDEVVELTTEPQHFEYDFDMTSDSDANGRIEYNLGNQGSSSTVHINNVSLIQTGEIEISSGKSILPDGNYVHNGGFQEGDHRLGSWEIENNCGAEVSVTNDQNIRELKCVVPDGVGAPEELLLRQTDLALTGDKTCVLTFDAYADSALTISAEVGGARSDFELTPEMNSYKFEFTTASDLDQKDLVFLLGTPGTIFLDNVRLQETGLLINGDFSNGLTGYQVWADGSASESHIVDSLNEANAFAIDIENSGDQDWKIQLKQILQLEKGKTYKLSFDAKSTLDRNIAVDIERDGSKHSKDGAEDWTEYCPKQVVALSSDYQTFETTFTMEEDTDPEAIFSMKFGGDSITQKHTVCIDNIELTEE